MARLDVSGRHFWSNKADKKLTRSIIRDLLQFFISTSSSYSRQSSRHFVAFFCAADLRLLDSGNMYNEMWIARNGPRMLGGDADVLLDSVTGRGPGSLCL